MMALAVGELGVCRGGGGGGGVGASSFAPASSVREKIVCQNGCNSKSVQMQSSKLLQKNRVEIRTTNWFGRVLGFGVVETPSASISARCGARASSSAEAPEKPKQQRYPGESKGFVEEMRFVAMRLHTKDQAKEGEKEKPADVQPVGKWEPTVEGYLKFLVDSKKVYDTMETIVAKASHPSYELFRNTGLERAERLGKDIEWFSSQGHTIPEAGPAGTSYSELLMELSETNVPAFICHFYNIYFAHSAGGKFIGKKVAEMILDGRELEFYKWDGELSELLAAVKANLNKVAEEWTREEKNKCLEETENSFKYSGKILREIISQ